MSLLNTKSDPYKGMSLEDRKFARLEEIFKHFDNSLSKEEFIDAFEVVRDYVKSIEEKNSSEFEQMGKTLKELSDRVSTDTTTNFNTLKKQVLEQVATRLSNLKDGYTPVKGKDYQDGVTPIKGVDYVDGIDGKDGSPDTGDEIVNKINNSTSLISKKSIEGFSELEKEVDKRVSQVESRAVQTPAKAYRIYTKDATAQCNGVNKAFTVGGSHFGIIGVFGTQFPNIYRPIIDYTETATGVLLTNQVTAPDTGQTLIIQFLK